MVSVVFLKCVKILTSCVSLRPFHARNNLDRCVFKVFIFFPVVLPSYGKDIGAHPHEEGSSKAFLAVLIQLSAGSILTE